MSRKVCPDCRKKFRGTHACTGPQPDKNRPPRRVPPAAEPPADTGEAIRAMGQQRRDLVLRRITGNTERAPRGR